MRIVISNIVTLNVGDAAILQGTMAVLRRAFGDGVEILVFDKAAEAARRYYPWASFRQALFARRPASGLRRALHDRGWSHRLRRVDAWRFRAAARWLGRAPWVARLFVDGEEAADLEAYRSADLVISSGGTYLVEKYGLEPPILDYELTLALDRRLVFFTQSLGPFRGSEHRRRLGRIFRSAAVLFVRDDPSVAHLLDLDVPAERIVRCADAAFALAGDVRVRSPRNGPPRVAVSVRGWRHFRTVDPEEGERRYLDAVAALVERLVRSHGARVTFVSTCQGMPEYWTDDTVAARAVVERLSGEVAGRVRVDTEARGPDAMIDTYAGFDLVVATRMHAAILALCAGTPVLPIAYEFKTRELFERMGLSEWVTDIEEISPGTFAELGEACLARLEELRAAVRREVPGLCESAFAPAAVLRDRVGSAAGK